MPVINTHKKASTYTSRRNSIDHHRQLSTRAAGTSTHHFDAGSPHHNHNNYDAFGDVDGAPVEIHRIPDNQVELSDEQKNEVFTKVITATNPKIDKNAVRFNYVEGKFALNPT